MPPVSARLGGMPLLLIASERFGDHLTPPGHVERVERAHVFDAVATAWRKQGGAIVEPRAATRDELLAIHSAEHIAAMESTAGRAVMLDPDTFTSPESEELARLAAGAVCLGVEHALAAARAGVRAGAAAGASCRARSADGVLSL